MHALVSVVPSLLLFLRTSFVPRLPLSFYLICAGEIKTTGKPGNEAT